MTDTNTGWRKRQIALDIKAENARELGLDYEPNKTIEMAREAGIKHNTIEFYSEELKSFAALVRADEREACAKVCDYMALRYEDMRGAALESVAESIRLRGQA